MEEVRNEQNLKEQVYIYTKPFKKSTNTISKSCFTNNLANLRLFIPKRPGSLQ